MVGKQEFFWSGRTARRRSRLCLASRPRPEIWRKCRWKLGGKSPAIILPDADIDAAIAGAANAIFFNHGQCCCAGSRLFARKNEQSLTSYLQQVFSYWADALARASAGFPDQAKKFPDGPI
jgi:hypothetical protein